MQIERELIENFINSDDFSKKTEMCELMTKYESDKSIWTSIYGGWHNYSSLYHYLFSDVRDKNINFFELGVFKGSSIRAFNDYFPNANLFAGDCDPETFFELGKVNFHICDQDNTESIKKMWNDINLDFDIIIEDGKHEYQSNYNFLINSMSNLKRGGIFIVEDLTINTLLNFQYSKAELKEKFSLRFIECFEISNENNKIDNNILVIQK
jgi:hypothetical protein